MRKHIGIGKRLGGFPKLGGIQSADSGYLIRMNSKNCSGCFVLGQEDLREKVDILTETVVYFAAQCPILGDSFSPYNIIPLIFQGYLFSYLSGFVFAM